MSPRACPSTPQYICPGTGAAPSDGAPLPHPPLAAAQGQFPEREAEASAGPRRESRPSAPGGGCWDTGSAGLECPSAKQVPLWPSSRGGRTLGVRICLWSTFRFFLGFFRPRVPSAERWATGSGKGVPAGEGRGVGMGTVLHLTLAPHRSCRLSPAPHLPHEPVGRAGSTRPTALVSPPTALTVLGARGQQKVPLPRPLHPSSTG